MTGCPQGRERREGTLKRGADGSEGGRGGSGEELVQALFEVVIFACSFDQGWSCNSATLKNISTGCLKKHVPNLGAVVKKKIWPKVRHVSLRGGGQKFQRAGVSLDFG